LRKKQLIEEVEQLRVQLAGCSTAAGAWNNDPAVPGDYGWSVSYQDVLGLRNEYDSLIENQIPFSAYYAERLEHWKGKFDKIPLKHYVTLSYKESSITKVLSMRFNTIEEATDKFNEWNRFRIADAGIKEYFTDGSETPGLTIVVAAKNVETIKLEPGHPDPYTPEEIEAWAKEQLEKEMQGWKVVKAENAEQGWPWKVVEFKGDPIYGLNNEKIAQEILYNQKFKVHCERMKYPDRSTTK